MKGLTYRAPDTDTDDGLPLWQSLVVNAVGQVIEFWGFKRNHGRLWALLYLRGVPMTAAQLQDGLDLSKGAVSMITRDLEQWGIVRRVRVPGESASHFVAEVEFMRMIGRVLREREMTLLEHVVEDLADAEVMAREDDAGPEVVARIRRMKTLASVVRQALELFLKTARLDIGDARDVLSTPLGGDAESPEGEAR